MTLVTKTKRESSDALYWKRQIWHFNQQDGSSLVDVRELEFCEASTVSKMHEIAVQKNTNNRESAVVQQLQ